MNKKVKLSIVVPCYNEAENLVDLLKGYDDAVTREDVEVVLVNNGSTDDTEKILDEYAPRYSFLKVVRIGHNQGYGYGIVEGLKAASGEFIGWTHGDLQTPPSDALKALAIIEARGNDTRLYVKGKRKGRPFFESFYTFGMSIFETLYLGTPLSDINAQPNVFHKDFYASWKNPPHDFSLDLYALYKAKRAGLAVLRFPVFFLPRTRGASSWNTGLAARWKLAKKTLAFSAALKSAEKSLS